MAQISPPTSSEALDVVEDSLRADKMELTHRRRLGSRLCVRLSQNYSLPATSNWRANYCFIAPVRRVSIVKSIVRSVCSFGRSLMSAMSVSRIDLM